MKLQPTKRGFMYGEFIDTYKSKCSIKKSSAALYDAIWLGIDDPDPKIMVSDAIRLGILDANSRSGEERNGWMPYPLPEEVSLNSHMHLTQEMVKTILPTLQVFAETGELIPTDEYAQWKVRFPDVKIDNGMIQVVDAGKSAELYFTPKFIEHAKVDPYAYRVVNLFERGASPQEIIEVLCMSLVDMLEKIKELSSFQAPAPIVVNMDWNTAPDWVKEKFTKKNNEQN